MADETPTPEVAPDTPDEPAAEEPAAADEPVVADRPHSRFDALIFDRWDPAEVVVRDLGLARYIHLEGRFSIHTGARHANKWFGKARLNLVERFVNQLMRTGKYTGKKTKALKVCEEAFEIVHAKTKQNPLQVLVEAIENAAPREEVTRLRYGGISVPKAVDTAPSRRIDWALRHLSQGSLKASYKSTKPIAQCVADELIKASRGQSESFAVGKKDEIERVAGSAR